MPTNSQVHPLPLATKSARSALRALSVGCAIALTTASAHAEVVTSISGGADRSLRSLDTFTSDGAGETGFVFTSTNASTVFGYSGGYGLASNGRWDGGSFVGLNAGSNANAFFTLTFEAPVASVLAFVNYAPGYGTPYIAAYDPADHLIESVDLTVLTPNGYNAGESLGFAEASNSIKSIRFGDAYIVATNILAASIVTANNVAANNVAARVDATAVPIPNTVLLMGIGIGALLFATRRRKGAAVVSFPSASMA